MKLMMISLVRISHLLTKCLFQLLTDSLTVGMRPSTSNSSNASSFNSQTVQSPSHVSPAEAAGIINKLKDKSVEELRKLLSDKDAYNHFLHSLDQVKIQDNLRDELRRETLQLTRENLDKEPQIMELRNQKNCSELEKQKEETLKAYSPASLLQKLQEVNDKIEEEFEALHKQLLDREIDLPTCVQKYKKLRATYHRQSLVFIAAKTSTGAQ